MTPLQALFAAVSAVVLFLYGLHGFSHELQTVGGTALQSWLGRVTASRWRGFAAGAMATAVVQSSSAVTALTTALVDAGVISFRASLAVVLGSNVGTTATAWLVSFKLTGIGPFFIVLGAVVSAVPTRLRVIGKAVFYFGLIFFALDLISTELKPLQDQPAFKAWIALAQAPWLGVLTGLVFTALIQSSSVTTGVAILLVQQGVNAARGRHPHRDWGQRGLNLDGSDGEPWHAANGPRDRGLELPVQRCRRDRLLSVPDTLCACGSEFCRGSRPRCRLGAPGLQFDDWHRVSRDAGADRASSETVDS